MLKTDGLGPLLGVDITCTPSWREAHLHVKSVKNRPCLTTFVRPDVEKALTTTTTTTTTTIHLQLQLYSYNYTTLHPHLHLQRQLQLQHATTATATAATTRH